MDFGDNTKIFAMIFWKTMPFISALNLKMPDILAWADDWSEHYTPGGKKTGSAATLIGSSRSREITVNILLPIGLIYARASRSVEMEAA